MKIGIDARLIDTAGVRRYLEGLISNLYKADKKNEYFIYFSKPEQLTRYPLDHPNLNKVLIPADAYSLKEQGYLPYRIKKDCLDLFHVTYDFCVPLLQPCKVVVTIHDLYVTPQDSKYFRSFMTKNYGRWMTHHSVMSSTQIITISNFIKRKLLRVFPKAAAKASVIHHGVDQKFGKIENPVLVQAVKRKYKLPDDYILYMGSFKPKKNLLRLIEAFDSLPDLLKQKYPLILAGKPGYQYNAVQELVIKKKLQNYVKFIGFVPDEEIVPLYNGATLFVFPSMHEGFGFPLLEALACGLPTVSSSAASMPEIAEEAALFADPLSVEEISQSILKILSDPLLRKKMSSQGIKQAHKFSWDRTVEQTVEVYEKCIKSEYQ